MGTPEDRFSQKSKRMPEDVYAHAQEKHKCGKIGLGAKTPPLAGDALLPAKIAVRCAIG